MIGLVSCSSTKLDHAAPAHELYTSPLFRKSLAYALASCSQVYILSALHGLVELYRELAPYDFRLSERRKADRENWARVIAATLVARHGREVPYVFLAGAEYARPIGGVMRTIDGFRDGPDGCRWRGVPRELVLEPMAGMQVGERLRWLNAQLKEAA